MTNLTNARRRCCMRTVFDAACNLIAWLYNTVVWDVIDAGGKWARKTAGEDEE